MRRSLPGPGQGIHHVTIALLAAPFALALGGVLLLLYRIPNLTARLQRDQAQRLDALFEQADILRRRERAQ